MCTKLFLTVFLFFMVTCLGKTSQGDQENIIKDEKTTMGNQKVKEKEKPKETIEHMIEQMSQKMTQMENDMGKKMTEIENNMDKFHLEMKNRNAVLESLVLDIVPSDHLVFYPYGTKDHFALKHYQTLGLSFLGFGYAAHSDAHVYKFNVTLEDCLNYCRAARKQKGDAWNDLKYFLPSKQCYCFKSGSGHVVNHRNLHYRFA